MGNEIFVALELLGVGMITVFFVLFLVVSIGDLIIKLVNKYIPEQAIEVVPPAKNPIIDNKIVSVITATVNVVTGGKGRITKIEKV